ncbi:esterase E4-like [Diprion similis]|uniref:esterase E4-like n=1 Tax=Diprion similis TaxID=362088 RepID=UPI001EF927ED|nr:esterase E4-like [Diprion similis]
MAEPIVNVKQGSLRGTTVKSVIGESYLAFNGIPFAAPPIGNLRFLEPQPVLPWKGVRDATTEGPKCVQFNMLTSTLTGDEDCLYLNVATKSLKGSRPVMVWIHGGAFVFGDATTELASPDYLMKTDIVFVSIQYRLGVLGFLHLDHEAAPGNMGLKDQVAALKWVQENIAEFGGDPNNVTIFGCSAGGASVHYLLLSPLAKGLFHKAISQSGVTLNPWVSTSNSIETAHSYVALLGKKTTDPHEIVEYLRTIPADKLLLAEQQVQTREDKIRFILPFRPSVDSKSPRPFMPKRPLELAKNGFDVPAIIGYASHEGSFFLMGLTTLDLPFLDEHFEIAVTEDLVEANPSKISEVATEIRKFYFKDKPINKDVIGDYIQCYGDIYFANGIHKVVEYQQNKRTPTYLYRFSYDSPTAFGRLAFGVSEKGAGHGDETTRLFYPMIFGENIKIDPHISSVDKTVSDRMVRMWTDFAKTGNPTPQIDDLITVKWKPVTPTEKNYIDIGVELSVGVNPDEEVQQFFRRISEIVESELDDIRVIYIHAYPTWSQDTVELLESVEDKSNESFVDTLGKIRNSVRSVIESDMADYVVNVKEGCLRGTTVKSIVGGSYVAFKGIPFAAPPVGNLRFADPQSPQPWKGVRDASQERSKCIQIDTTTSSVVGDEDCLYLNVTTTSLKGSRPVMVWIHGGGFMTGDASLNMYGPDYLMKTEIVFVSIQYRLGVFGFLQLDHDVVPGNAGLKDQVAALKWVKENIAQFGGDPNNVTIFGESAGSASVHFHLLSPLSKGFFHKAIMQSGVTLNPWIVCTVSVSPAHLLAATLGKETTDPHEIVEHLRTVPAEKLLFAQEEACTREDKFHFLVSFRPCVDDKSQQPFMPKLPQDLVENGVDVPVIIGYNTHEGLISLMP